MYQKARSYRIINTGGQGGLGAAATAAAALSVCPGRGDDVAPVRESQNGLGGKGPLKVI